MMNISDEYDDDVWPDWLVDIAVTIDEWVAGSTVMERFRTNVRRWKTEHDARVSDLPRRKRFKRHYNPVEFRPRRRMSISAKYARLAAIHDTICKTAKSINPWGRQIRRRDPAYFEYALAGASYEVLCGYVGDLGDVDREWVVRIIADAGKDLGSGPAERAQELLQRCNRDLRLGKQSIRTETMQGSFMDHSTVVHVHAHVEGSSRIQESTRLAERPSSDEERGGPLQIPGPESKDLTHGETNKLPPSRIRAAAVYDWAIERIEGAKTMPLRDLLPAIINTLDSRIATTPSGTPEEEKLQELRNSLPDNAETFGKYLRDAGIRRYNRRGERAKRVSHFKRRGQV